MFHEIVLIGNLGGDPDMRYTPAGAAVTSFSIATTTRIAKGDKECPAGWKESYNGKHYELTTWWRISTWHALAELCNQYLKKGRTVFIKGEMRGENTNGTMTPRVWQDREGHSRASFEVTARVVKFLGSGDEDSSGGRPPSHEEEPPPGTSMAQRDIPF
jgi:single-strand DNA-binding protein